MFSPSQYCLLTVDKTRACTSFTNDYAFAELAPDSSTGVLNRKTFVYQRIRTFSMARSIRLMTWRFLQQASWIEIIIILFIFSCYIRGLIAPNWRFDGYTEINFTANFKCDFHKLSGKHLKCLLNFKLIFIFFRNYKCTQWCRKV